MLHCFMKTIGVRLDLSFFVYGLGCLYGAINQRPLKDYLIYPKINDKVIILSSSILILISVISLSIVLIIVLALMSGKKGSSRSSKKTKFAGGTQAVKTYSKRLMHDPLNVEALEGLGRIYFQAEAFDKALPCYQKLFALMKTKYEIDQKKTAIAYGTCAYKMQKFDDAKVAFQKVIVLEQLNYTANYFLGRMNFDEKEYDKAIPFLKRAFQADAESGAACEALGYALFETKRYHESLSFIRRAIDKKPGDKKLLFYFACALEESTMDDKALKVFTHLRTDLEYGPVSCLYCGKLHDKMGQFEVAIQDYDIALKSETIKPETKVEVLYNMAQDYIRGHNVAKALTYLQQIMLINPQFKDTARLVSSYSELNSNNNLQAYLMSGPSDFVVLCKKIVTGYFKNAYVKIQSVEVSSANVDVLCTVETIRWTSTEFFRFFRTTSIVGQLLVVDCFNKVKDSKYDKGYCVTAGTFSEESKKFVDGRPIDLVDKEDLIKVLKRIKL